MRVSSQIAAAAAAFLAIQSSSAWPWPRPAVFARDSPAQLMPRQNSPSDANTSPQPSATPSQTNSGPTTSTTSGTTTGSDSGSTSPTGTVTSGQTSGSNTQTTSGGTQTSGNATTITTSATPSINPADPAGSISMIQPAISSGTQYYRSGAPVTLIWQYTDLIVHPTAIDVVATIASTSGGDAYPTYTLASNQSFASTQTVVWDTGASIDGGQLPVAMYTMVVYDASNPSGISAVPQAGHLGAAQYAFGVYTHQAVATAYPDSQALCVTCSAASPGKMGFFAGGLFLTLVGGSMLSFLTVL